METTSTGPHLVLWLPCLLVAHFLSAFWLVQSFLLGRRSKPDAPTASEGAAGTAASQRDKDVEAGSQPNSVQFKLPEDAAVHLDVKEAPTAANQAIGISPKVLSINGGMQPCVSVHLTTEATTLEWRGIGCIVVDAGRDKPVLQDVWGKAFSGQMQALIGPSGAGKSTLMDILAMRKSKGRLSGCLLVNGRPASTSFIKTTSYVPQEDTFVPTMTSRETLAFYGGVGLGGVDRTGSKWTRSKRKERVEEVLAALGLSSKSDTLVGGTLPGGLQLRGLSGGERRRLSIAAGILGAPSVLFLDEPTSGLDSFAALKVMGHLKFVACATNQTVIATIHQPRSAIWELFDLVTLLASGRQLFHGRRADIVPWFEKLGFTYTRGSEPDWVLDLVATGFDDKPVHLFGHTMRTRDDVDAAADAFKEHLMREQHIAAGSPAESSSGSGDSELQSGGLMTKLAVVLAKQQGRNDFEAASRTELGSRSVTSSVIGSLRDFNLSLQYPTSWFRQFSYLFWREVASMTRNPFDVVARIMTFTWVALLFGLMGYNVELQGLDGFNSINNMLFTAVLIMLLMPYLGISLYTADKQMYIADASARRYRPSSYYAAKVLSNMPFTILGSVLYCGIFYGMCGLRPGGIHFAKFAAIIAVLAVIASQVLHLCAVVAPNYDTTFALSILWTSVQMLASSFFLNFNQVWMQWLTQLRYLSAAYFAIEAIVLNEFTGQTSDCSQGLEARLVDTLKAGLATATPLQLTMLERMKQPQPGCVFQQDALVAPLGFSRPFGVSMGILLGYLGVLHVLTFLGLLFATKNERR